MTPTPASALLAKRQPDSEPFVFPTECPCHVKSTLVRPAGEANHYCNHPECPEQLLRRIEHFASRNAMNIDGLGEKLLAQNREADAIGNYRQLLKEAPDYPGKPAIEAKLAALEQKFAGTNAPARP